MNVAYVTSKDFLGDTVRSENRTESGKFSKIAAFKEICAFGSAGDDNDLLLKVGTAYDFSLLNSSGAKTEQKVLAFTTTDGTYSPVAQDTTSTNTRMEQEVVCKVVSSAVVSASGTWSGLAFSNAPGDWSAATTAPVLVELTADSTLEINTDVNVESIVFAVPENVTLTLTGSKAITATTAISIKGGGSVCVAAGADVLSGPVKVASGTTFTFDFANVAAPTAENPFGDALLAACSFSVLGSAQFSNVPANTIASIGDCGIRLVHNSVFGKWNATGQSMYAWRSAGTSGNFSACSVAPVTTSSGAVGGTETITWGKFCNGNSSYSAPAPAFYFDSAEYSMQRTPNFSPLTIGGLLVTAGGSTIERSDGQLELGDTRSTDAKIETYFVLAQSFGLGSFGKGGSYPNKIYGTVNIEAVEGATLTLPSQGITLDTATAANLKMHGAGNIALTGTITATGNVTLDYSDVDSGNTFIRGSLTVDASTKLVLPSWLSEGTPYTLCTGTLTAPSIVTEGSVQIGDGEATTAILLYNTTAKTVAYYTSIPEFTGTVSGSTIAWDSEPTQEQYAIAKIVLIGSGDVTLPYKPLAINAGSGVTVDVTSFTTPTLLGAGTFRWTSGYPTTIPSAEYSYEYVGGATEATKVTVSDVLTINGNLKTSGYIALTGANTLAAGGSLEVLSDKTELAAVQGVQANGWSGGLGGTITVDANAELASLTTDALTRGGSVVNINVYGTLNLGTTRWTMQSSQYHRLNLHGNAEVKGSGDGNGILDFENANSSYVNINVYDGTPTISGPLKFRAKTITWIEANAKLAVTGGTINNGEFAKSGAGTLSFSAVAPSTSGGLSASAGTIELDNISYTAGTITLSSAQNSPTLKMIATDAATTVSAAVNVPTNTRGQLAFEGAGTFALSGPNTNGSIVWLGTNPVPGTLQLNDNVTINNGSRGSSYVFNKVIGSGTLTLSTWEGCYNSNDNGLTYTINTIDADSFAGAIALKNVAAPNRQDGNNDCTLKFAIGDIKKSSAVYGTAIVGLTTNITAGAHGVNSIDVDLSSTTFNNSPATFLYDGSTGVYLAAATLTTSDDTVVPFKTVQEAVNATINPLYDGYKYITVNVDDTTVNAVDTTLKIKYGAGVSSFTVNSPYAEYDSDGGITDGESGITTYSLAPAATTYTWVATGDGVKNWTTPANWTYGSGTAATRHPTTCDTVVFNNGANVTLDSTMTVAGIAVNGAVSISGSAKSLNTSGNITGEGTLTLSDICLASVGAELTVSPSVNFTNDSELARVTSGKLILNGDITASGTFKSWDVTHTVNGDLSIASGVNMAIGTGLEVNGSTTFNGNFSKSQGGTLTLGNVRVAKNTAISISSGSIAITGTVTIDPGVTLAIPASGLTVGDSASFVLSGRSSVLVDNGSGASGKVGTSLTDGAKVISSTTAGVTTYKVVYGTIFSVW